MTSLNFTNRKPSLAARPSSLSEGEMGLGLGWWSVQRSFVERRSAASDQTSAPAATRQAAGSYNKKKEH
jgi:hypothetical protein